MAVLLTATSAPALAVPADFAAKADALIARSYPADGPGAAVIVTERGKTVYARGQGMADIAAGKPITPATVFRLGSITKQFSAAVLMQLVQEGKVALDDPLSKYLPDYPQGQGITIRQLLNHSSGVQSYTGIAGWMVEKNTSRALTTDELIAEFKDLPPPSKPGERWDYNNSGYVLVGAVIEKVTGKPWHQAVEERIAAPLNLSTIRFGETRLAGMAQGYTGGESGPKLAQKIHMNVPHAAGGLIGTVGDLAAWAHALHHGKVVNASSYAAMTTPTKTSDGKETPYGFGLGMDEVRGRKLIGHNGGIFGFSTESMYFPEQDMFVAVFANSDDPATSPGVTAQRLAALAFGDPYREFSEAKVDPKSLEPLFGIYKIADSESERRFYQRDGQLYTQRTGASESKVFAAGNNRFFYGPNSLNWFEVKTGPGGTVMEMHQGGADKAELSTRTGPIPPDLPSIVLPRATLDAYAGDYAVGGMTAKIAVNGEGQLTTKLGDQPTVPLRALSATEFQPRGIEARVVFTVVNGAATAFTIHQGGRKIELKRVEPAN
jgi:CubicO group peptidase (beta-lactamase class C family)